MPPKRPRLSASAELENEDLSSAIAATEDKVADVDSLQSLLVALEARKAALDEKERKQRIVEEEMAMNRERVGSIVKLNLRGKVFKTYKETLLKVEDTYFFRMLSSGRWQPDEDGEYFIDTRYEGFERVLAYLSSGELSVKGLNEYEKECVFDNLSYFQIPYTKSYTMHVDINELNSNDAICELADGRLCAAVDISIVVWNMRTKSTEITFTGHTLGISGLIQVEDGRIISSSADLTIRVWNLETKSSELTLFGHAGGVNCIAQLSDGRLCSGSADYSIRLWNLDTGLCERTIDTSDSVPFCFAQLSDGRVCIGCHTGDIEVWNVESGVCELTLEGHCDSVESIADIGNSTICSCSSDLSVKVWNVSSSQCERTLRGHRGCVHSVVRMHDGRLCTASEDSTMRIWNAETGDCERVLHDNDVVYRGLQLDDGRLLAATERGVRIWS